MCNKVSLCVYVLRICVCIQGEAIAKCNKYVRTYIHTHTYIHTYILQELEKLKNEGKIRSLGLSNYAVEDYKELQQVTTIKPCINQIQVFF